MLDAPKEAHARHRSCVDHPGDRLECSVQDLPILLALIPHAIYITGGFLYFRGGQYRAREAMRALTSNPKTATVLYLRPFRSDPKALLQTLPMLSWGGGFNLLTHTECLADALKPFGQMLIVGRPGEGLPRPGAASLYTSNAEWQALVIEKMSTARLVVIRPGRSDGIMWNSTAPEDTFLPIGC